MARLTTGILVRRDGQWWIDTDGAGCDLEGILPQGWEGKRVSVFADDRYVRVQLSPQPPGDYRRARGAAAASGGGELNRLQQIEERLTARSEGAHVVYESEFGCAGYLLKNSEDGEFYVWAGEDVSALLAVAKAVIEHRRCPWVSELEQALDDALAPLLVEARP